mmetsp:Transcript_48730/g.54526  ORF Transcript_48730/g.54526 Transcript_48730/m.54526 type:complete len:736 (+) Transcript_48730:144-2351(+)
MSQKASARPLLRQRERAQSSTHPHSRCVLLFDMDCFYAQCERLRLGLPLDVKLCLFQWNSVLAVTYPARKYGIKRGDNWDDVARKSGKKNDNGSKDNNYKIDDGCWTIHLPIIRCDKKNKEMNDLNINGDQIDDVSQNHNDSYDIETEFQKVYKLSREEQLRCQREENGVRHCQQSGKASLERYRLASIRIFSVVLESLTQTITRNNGYSFVLEKASVDEFYLDITDYCYRTDNKNNKHGNEDSVMEEEKDEGHKEGNFSMDNGIYEIESVKTYNKTVVAGQINQEQQPHPHNETDEVEIALNRACQVSTWIREALWKTLGFTMSCGISTNKTMAKLAALYGKPNGQAVLYPRFFPEVLRSTKITKVRNFGGKLGKTVLKILLNYQKQQQQSNIGNINIEDLSATSTMEDLIQIPLPFLLQSKLLSEEAAHFVFQACRGIENEAVKETTGALVKSITAFKSFPATKSHTDIFDMWLKVLSKEIIERVARDTARNNRYPKTCTLNYTYYTTSSGHRPLVAVGASTRSQRQNRSLRLKNFPSERETITEKSTYLVAEAKSILIHILKDHPLRGIGLSVSNFESKRDESMPSIQSFFSTITPSSSISQVDSSTCNSSQEIIAAKPCCVESCGKKSNQENAEILEILQTEIDTSTRLLTSKRRSSAMHFSSPVDTKLPQTQHHSQSVIGTLEDEDLNYAKQLQATFDRENYVLSTSNSRQRGDLKTKTRRIDTFFAKRG